MGSTLFLENVNELVRHVRPNTGPPWEIRQARLGPCLDFEN